MSGNKPVRTIRIGLVSASVFANSRDADEGKEDRVNHSVQLQRRYRDDEGWKTTQTLGLADLPVAIQALKMALDFVAEREAVVRND